MSIFVVYFSNPRINLYAYQDFEGKASWLEVWGNKEVAAKLKEMVEQGWIPRACEIVPDVLAISTGQSGIASRIFDLIDEHGEYDFRPLYPEKKAVIVWKEGEKVPVEVWSSQDRSNIDFSKITGDLCKGATGNNSR